VLSVEVAVNAVRIPDAIDPFPVAIPTKMLSDLSATKFL